MTTTTERVLEMRERDPRRRATDMAREIGVSQQRIQQILVKQGLPTQIPAIPTLCPDCKTAELTWGAKRCRECYFEDHRIHTTCGYCKADLVVKKSYYRRYGGQNFCNTSHWAKWGWLSGNPLATRKGRTLKRHRSVDTEPSN